MISKIADFWASRAEFNVETGFYDIKGMFNFLYKTVSIVIFFNKYILTIFQRLWDLMKITQMLQTLSSLML